MAFFSTNLTSFAWGALLGGVIAFATGFLKKAGEHAFSFVKNKISPEPPEPIQVDGYFRTILFPANELAWVKEALLYEYEQKGYRYYPHPHREAHCYRITSDGGQSYKEFLLVRPSAKEVKNL